MQRQMTNYMDFMGACAVERTHKKTKKSYESITVCKGSITMLHSTVKHMVHLLFLCCIFLHGPFIGLVFRNRKELIKI